MIDGSDSLSRMIGLFRLGGKFEDSDGMKYITQVFKSNKYGIVGRNKHPLYETEHNSLSEAILGHKETVEFISSHDLF